LPDGQIVESSLYHIVKFSKVVSLPDILILKYPTRLNNVEIRNKYYFNNLIDNYLTTIYDEFC